MEKHLYTPDEMRTHQEAMAREMDELHAKNKAVLEQVQALVSPEAFLQIEDTLSDSGNTHSYLIADSPLGDPQNDGFVLGDVYYDQTMDGGISGDSYAGTMSMPLQAGQYFQFNYAY